MIALTAHESARGQSLDSAILNENTLTRALTTHAHQFRAYGEYHLAFNRNRFETDGSRIDLLETGTSSIRNTLNFQVRYGITERLQASARITHVSHTERLQTVYRYVGFTDIAIEENVTVKNNGLSDLLLGLDWRLPVGRHDWVISAGAFVPVAEHEPPPPEILFFDSPDYYDFRNDHVLDITYRRPQGDGVFQYLLGSTFKFRMKKMAVTAGFDYLTSFQSGKTVSWQYRLQQDSTITFRDSELDYRLGYRVGYHVAVERQLLPWFSANMFYDGVATKNGWTSNGVFKVSNRPNALHVVGIGYELLVTHKFWLRQSVSFSIAGINALAPIEIKTYFIYNLFPGVL